ncbi:DNA-3-methyladenine glycosylase, putative [Plasmodium vivax]|uniref:DNA-3-methyladenine glycosylase II n=1 Tax=Plasmodium vivax TaxID=5855 RepID=A0A564ZZ22_PLAVI|nr:DNA-3-methyladenine glycosylase, putative [Plasmodium vivax]
MWEGGDIPRCKRCRVRRGRANGCSPPQGAICLRFFASVHSRPLPASCSAGEKKRKVVPPTRMNPQSDEIMQNEQRRRKRRGSLATTASSAVTKRDKPGGEEKGKKKKKIKKHTIAGANASAKANASQLESMAYVYILMEYFFENNEVTVFTEKFYLQEDVLSVTEALIGHILWVYDRGKKKLYGSRITELEAYKGSEDKASHAYNNKKTNRNATMFERGGVSYVYLCYGIHNCLNIVTNGENIPDAILVRSLEPFYGAHDILLNRYEIHSGGSKLGGDSPGRAACAVEGDAISYDYPDGPTPPQSNHSLDKEKLQRIDSVKAILKTINMKKLAKVCSGPGCVTKCLDITRQDDRASFFSDVPPYPTQEGKLTWEGKPVGGCAAEGGDLPEGAHPASEGKNVGHDHCPPCNVRQDHCSPCRLNDLQRSRFFISICPSPSEVINFYESLVAQKREKHNYMQGLYTQHKSHLLEYLDRMKWDQEKMVVQRDKRVGVAYAEEAALYDYRFLLKGHPSISVPPK